MKKLQNQVLQGSLAGLMVIAVSLHVRAEETIIQQEKLSFERCLKVITTSQDKLSVARKLPTSQIKSVSPSSPLSTALLQLLVMG